MPYKTWITMFFPTPLFFRYHLPLSKLHLKCFPVCTVPVKCNIYVKGDIDMVGEEERELLRKR